MSLKLVTPAATYPVTLAEVKLHCRVDVSDDDALLNTFIAAATTFVEQYTGRALVTQTWELYLDAFSDAILIPRGPLQSVVSVKYYDESEVLQTLDATNYQVDDVNDPSWIVRASDVTYPTVAEGVNNVIVRFTAGYASVPEPIRAAILLLVAQWYDERSSIPSIRLSSGDTGIPTLPFTVEALLANYRAF